MNIIKNLCRLAAAIAGVAAVTNASAQVKWDMYAFSGATHPVTVRLQGFADEVRKQTDGQLIITVRPAGEFPFKASEVFRATGTGQVQIGEGYSGFISGAVPLASVANLPMLVRNTEDLNKVWPVIKKYAEPEFQKQGVKILFHFEWPPQNIFGRGNVVTKFEDLAGKKFRTTDAKQSEALKLMGASAVSLTAAEVPLAVERGVVDGFLTAGFNVVGAKWYDAVKWAYLPDLNAGGPDYILVNIAAYNKLSPKVREALDKVAEQWGPKMTRENTGDEARDLEILKTKHGVTLVRPSKEEIDRLTAKVAPTWDAWAKQHGPRAIEQVKEIREILKR
jgi:TRAP-type C4-dicarboxylate transport system substrate-binding protein